MNDIYENIEEYNPNIKQKMLIVFDHIFSDMFRNKKLTPIVTELFIRGRKPNIYLVFTAQFYFAAPKSIKTNSAHYFIMKIADKSELQPITFNH